MEAEEAFRRAAEAAEDLGRRMAAEASGGLDDEVKAFVERLLDDWAADQWSLDAEFGTGPSATTNTEAEIDDRRAEWQRIITKERP